MNFDNFEKSEEVFMSYRGYRRYGTVRRRAPYRRRAAYRPLRRIVPRRRVLSRAPAGLYGGRNATEMKSVDGTASGSLTLSLVNTGTISLVQSPPLNGAAFYQRIGTRTRAVSLEIRGHVNATNAKTANIAQGFVRILVLYDRQPNGALPAVADILTDYNAGGSTQSVAYSGLNMNNRDRFLVLRDRKMQLPGVTAVAGGFNSAVSQGVLLKSADDNESVIYREFIKLKGLETHYKSSAGGIGDIATGSFLILGFNSADDGANGGAAFQLSYQSRFKFFD